MPKRLSPAATAADVGLPQSTIKYYADLGLLPYWRDGDSGHRRYEVDAVRERLEIINKLKDDGLTMRGIVSHFADNGLLTDETLTNTRANNG